MNPRRLACLVVTALVIASCATPSAAPAGSVSPASSTSSAGSPAATKLVHWKHGIVAAKADASILLMAKEKDFFRQQGIEIEYLQFDGDVTALKALVAGELDSMEASPSGTIGAVDHGADLKIVGTTMPGMPYALYAKKDIATVKDLRGKTLGISAPGALPEVIAKAILFQQGVPPDAVTFANAGADAQRIAAIQTGKVDAAAAATEFRSLAAKDPNLKVLALASDYVPEYLRFTVVMTGKGLREKPREVVASFLAAHMLGLRYALAHRDEALALCAKTINEPATGDRCTSTYDLIKKEKYVDPNMEFDVKRLDWLQDLRMKLGLQKAKIATDRFLDLSYRDDALKKVGRAP